MKTRKFLLIYIYLQYTCKNICYCVKSKTKYVLKSDSTQIWKKQKCVDLVLKLPTRYWSKILHSGK